VQDEILLKLAFYTAVRVSELVHMEVGDEAALENGLLGSSWHFAPEGARLRQFKNGGVSMCQGVGSDLRCHRIVGGRIVRRCSECRSVVAHRRRESLGPRNKVTVVYASAQNRK
jgi:hypothetical protein